MHCKHYCKIYLDKVYCNLTTIGNIMFTNDAVQYFGGRRQLAEALNITRQAVEQWGEIVAQGAAYKLQVITKGKLVVDSKKYK